MSSSTTESRSAAEAEAGVLASIRRTRERARRVDGDRIFGWILGSCAALTLALAGLIAYELISQSLLSMRTFGLGFVTGTSWDPVAGEFGAAPFVFGTLVSSGIALLIAGPVGVGAAVLLSEIVRGRRAAPLRFLVELLAAIPSVVYGLWGIFVIVPLMQTSVQPFLSAHLGFIPLFEGAPYGVGLLTAGVVLAVMILPTITSVCIDVLRAVPHSYREAAYALGSTRWEVIGKALLPAARTGISGAFILALGRALGETMAVTMVIGNRPEISASLLDPAHTLSAVLANEFAEASGDLYLSALTQIGLLLFAMTFVVNAVARLLVRRRKVVNA